MYDHAFLVFIKLRIINTACLVTGQVYSLGRKEYGRLGHGEENLEEKSEPTVIEELKGKKCEQISAGTATSFAIDEDGKLSDTLSVLWNLFYFYRPPTKWQECNFFKSCLSGSQSLCSRARSRSNLFTMNEARTVGTRAVGIRHKNLILPFNARVWFNSVAHMQLLSNYTNLFAVK